MMRSARRAIWIGATAVAAAGASVVVMAARPAVGGAISPAAATAMPESADVLVSRAVAEARAGHKVVLIEFGASWCVWCRHFQEFVHAPAVRDIVADNYVLVNLTVREREDKVALENPGGAEAMATWGGANAGLPFYVFLDAAGAKIADSNAMPDGQNIGFPATPIERDAFLGVLAKTAPRLDASRRATLRGYLTSVMVQ
jgi:thiol:disulfide interchange protein